MNAIKCWFLLSLVELFSCKNKFVENGFDTIEESSKAMDEMSKHFNFSNSIDFKSKLVRRHGKN